MRLNVGAASIDASVRVVRWRSNREGLSDPCRKNIAFIRSLGLANLVVTEMRILVVEDEKRSDFLTRGLPGRGYAVDSTEWPNGPGIVHATDYDLVILDIMLRTWTA